MEPEVVRWQTTGCHAGANSRASGANRRDPSLSLEFHFCGEERVRGPFGPTQWATVLLHLYQSFFFFLSMS